MLHLFAIVSQLNTKEGSTNEKDADQTCKNRQLGKTRKIICHSNDADGCI
jgi:hypothetical protein